jgi:hypothetical protein
MELISRNCFFSVFNTILPLKGGLRECVGNYSTGDVPVSSKLALHCISISIFVWYSSV